MSPDSRVLDEEGERTARYALMASYFASSMLAGRTIVADDDEDASMV